MNASLVPPLVLLAALLAVPARAQDPPVITWEEAARHVGDAVIVEGRVMGVHCSPLSCLLAFEPTFNGFTAVVQAGNFDLFPPAELERRYTGRRVRVRGTVRDRDKKPEIEVSGRDTLELVDAAAGEDDGAARAAEAQTAALERIADVLERLEALTERLAAVQERMDLVLESIEQRESALAAAAAAQAAAGPPAPATGEPVARPAFERLRSVKRGMTTDEVERLIGPPPYVETSGSGWITWDYGYGRTISFDARGRARSLVGFPRP